MIVNNDKFEIHVKGGFSDRAGITNFIDIVQVKSLNERTRKQLFNIITSTYGGLSIEKVYEINIRDFFISYIYTKIFSKSVREIPQHYGQYDISGVFDRIYNIICTYEYYDVLTFIEGIIKCLEMIDEYTYNSYRVKTSFISMVNNLFNEENVNYRIINDIVTDIIDENEIRSIDETLHNKYKTVEQHFTKALEQLYVVKDYDNSIKESISAVEAMCQIMVGDDKATLGEALKTLKNEIHSALREAYAKIYGYTSDANGIRHANGLTEGNATIEEARYMLVSCSAFINYLKEIFEKKEK